MTDTYAAIVDFVRSNPQSSRGRIAAYLGLAPAAATRALTALTRAGTLERTGTKRGATYSVAREVSHA